MQWRYRQAAGTDLEVAQVADRKSKFVVFREERGDRGVRRVRALRTDTGDEAWQLSARRPMAVAVGGGVTVTAVRTETSGWGKRATTEFTARSTDTGTVRWRHSSDRDHVLSTSPARRLAPPPFAVLADDRTVVAYRSDGVRDRNCAFEVLDRNGRSVRTFRASGPLAEDDSCFFDLVPTPGAMVVRPNDSSLANALV